MEEAEPQVEGAESRVKRVESRVEEAESRVEGAESRAKRGRFLLGLWLCSVATLRRLLRCPPGRVWESRDFPPQVPSPPRLSGPLDGVWAGEAVTDSG